MFIHQGQRQVVDVSRSNQAENLAVTELIQLLVGNEPLRLEKSLCTPLFTTSSVNRGTMYHIVLWRLTETLSLQSYDLEASTEVSDG